MKQRSLFSKPGGEVKQEPRGTNTPPKVVKRERQPATRCLNKDIMAKIQQRRLQLLIHSCIYYEFNDNLVTDQQYDKWSRELVQLQEEHPEESKAVRYYKEFKTFDGSTGFHLPKNSSIKNKAQYLIEMRRDNGKETN